MCGELPDGASVGLLREVNPAFRDRVPIAQDSQVLDLAGRDSLKLVREVLQVRPLPDHSIDRR